MKKIAIISCFAVLNMALNGQNQLKDTITDASNVTIVGEKINNLSGSAEYLDKKTLSKLNYRAQIEKYKYFKHKKPLKTLKIKA